MNLKALLEGMNKVSASDLHLKVGSSPILRIYSRLRPVEHPPVTTEEMEETIQSILPERLHKVFEEQGAADFAYDLPEVARFRVAAFHQRGHVSLAFRLIKSQIPSLEELNLPKLLEGLANLTHGLVLVAGVPGSGKSTTVASLVQRINNSRRVHVVTVESPTEYVFKDDLATINQMEVGTDSPSFQAAVHRIHRYDPNVILLGEIHDRETIETALRTVDIGYLVFTTLHHATDAKGTLHRILHFYDENEERIVRDQLARNMQAIITQRLLPRCDEPGLIPACEVLINVPTVAKLIRENRIDDIEQVMRNEDAGMQPLDVILAKLVRRKRVSIEEANRHCTHKANLQRMVRGEFVVSDKGRVIGTEDTTSVTARPLIG
ncbi:MAG TPA: PilT/PilU family type 4a pilus ATPase [Sumerlaeia bacterium]|nr:PilT/PilU family type 4a pilus ATPase [Sumerlaeia bacterium]